MLKYMCFFSKCGRVVCGNCSSSKSTYLPSTYVVSPPSQIFLESPHVPHRTCDLCMEELEMVRSALRIRSESGRRGEPSHDRGQSARRIPVSHDLYKGDGSLIQSVGVNEEVDDYKLCPICRHNIGHLDDTGKEAHIVACVEQAEFSGSPDKRRHNRMIVHQLTAIDEKDNEEGPSTSLAGECVICFEEFKPGDLVGRLECLCVFHERCILEWFSRKGAGSCPVHAVGDL